MSVPSCIVLDHVSLRFRSERGEVQALSDISLSVAGGRVHCAARSDRVRQELAVAPRQRSHSPDFRARSRCAAGRLLRPVGSISSGSYSRSRRCCHGARRSKRSIAARGRRLSAGATRCALRGVAQFSRAAQIQGRLSARAVGRHEAAGGDRAGAGVEPADPAHGRAVQRARRTHSRQLQDDLLQLWSRERKTVLFVTHNISEAIYLADRVVVMSPHPGRIKTILSPGLPRPRSEEMHESAEFMNWTRSCARGLKS